MIPIRHGGLRHKIRCVKMRHDGNGRATGPHGADDYADLGEADLPPSAAVHLADVTGRSVADFEADGYDHPDLGDLEEVTDR